LLTERGREREETAGPWSNEKEERRMKGCERDVVVVEVEGRV
jgi:hypothetical protein